MKLKINRKALALLTASSITLFSGCANNENNENDTNIENTPVLTESTNQTEQIGEHTHLIVNFDNTPVIFRECEGYSIDINHSDVTIMYNIYKNTTNSYRYDSWHHSIINGQASNYNYYTVTNEENVKPIEDAAIENGAYVYKLK